MDTHAIKLAQKLVTGKRTLFHHDKEEHTYIVPKKLFELKTGLKLPGDYIISSLETNFKGGESVHYTCTKNDTNFILKIYTDINLEQGSVYEILKNIKSKHLLIPLETGRLLDGHFFEIMPKMSHGTLQDLIDSPYSMDFEALIPEINEAIQALHAHGLIHSDIKPGNIYLNNDNHILLGDFGQTEIFNTHEIGTVKGKKQEKFTRLHAQKFLAPEVVSINTKPPIISTQSDYFSFGTTIIDLYTKGAWSKGELETKVLPHGETIILLPEIIPDHVKDLIYMLTQQERHKRPTYLEVQEWKKSPKKFKYSYQSSLEKHLIPIDSFEFNEEKYDELHSLLSAMEAKSKLIPSYVFQKTFKQLMTKLTPDKISSINRLYELGENQALEIFYGIIRVIKNPSQLKVFHKEFQDFNEWIAYAYTHYEQINPSAIDLHLVHLFLLSHANLPHIKSYLDTFQTNHPVQVQFDILLNMFNVQPNFYWQRKKYLSVMAFLKSQFKNEFFITPLPKQEEFHFFQCLQYRQDNQDTLNRIQKISDDQSRYFHLIKSIEEVYKTPFSFDMVTDDQISVSINHEQFWDWFGIHVMDEKKQKILTDKIFHFVVSDVFMTYNSLFSQMDQEVLQMLINNAKGTKNPLFSKAFLYYSVRKNKPLILNNVTFKNPQELVRFFSSLVEKSNQEDELTNYFQLPMVQGYLQAHGFILPGGTK